MITIISQYYYARACKMFDIKYDLFILKHKRAPLGISFGFEYINSSLDFKFQTSSRIPIKM